MSLSLLSAQLLTGPKRLFDYLKLLGINMLEVIFPFHYSTSPLIPLSESAEVTVTQTLRQLCAAPVCQLETFLELDAESSRCFRCLEEDHSLK